MAALAYIFSSCQTDSNHYNLPTNLDDSLTRQQNIRRFQIPMQHPVGMQVGNAIDKLPQERLDNDLGDGLAFRVEMVVNNLLFRFGIGERKFNINSMVEHIKTRKRMRKLIPESRVQRIQRPYRWPYLRVRPPRDRRCSRGGAPCRAVAGKEGYLINSISGLGSVRKLCVLRIHSCLLQFLWQQTGICRCTGASLPRGRA